jgi:hypothetical protein
MRDGIQSVPLWAGCAHVVREELRLMDQTLLAFLVRPKIMSAAKTRFEQVKLEELKKILPEQVLLSNGNENRNENNRGNQKDKKKDKRRVAEPSKPKSKA